MLALVRHGESTANAAGLLLGRSDVPLTEAGRAQVEALRPKLGAVVAVVSSPLRRALDTASALVPGRAVEVDDRWVEVDYGEHEGRPVAEVPSELWRRWRSDPSFRPEGGESLAEVGARVRLACEELFATPGGAARDREGDVVVVSHVSPIKAAVAWALGVSDGVVWRLHLNTASLTLVGWSGDAPVVHCYNWVP